MPDHIHLLVPFGDDVGKRLSRVLAQHGYLFGTAWDVETGYHYVNPVNDGIVDDPWKWPWSTLRDVGGLIVDPWTVEAVRRVAPVSASRILRSLTDAGNRTCPLPGPLDDRAQPVASLSSIAAAAAAASALRMQPDDIRRRTPARKLFVHAALACSPLELRRLAQACGVSVRAIQKIRADGPPPGLDCALRCLQDPRLLIHDVHPAR